MADQATPTEIVEITSVQHFHGEFLAAYERLKAGERVDIVLYDPEGYWPIFGGAPMLSTGLEKPRISSSA